MSFDLSLNLPAIVVVCIRDEYLEVVVWYRFKMSNPYVIIIIIILYYSCIHLPSINPIFMSFVYEVKGLLNKGQINIVDVKVTFVINAKKVHDVKR